LEKEKSKGGCIMNEQTEQDKKDCQRAKNAYYAMKNAMLDYEKIKNSDNIINSDYSHKLRKAIDRMEKTLEDYDAICVEFAKEDKL